MRMHQTSSQVISSNVRQAGEHGDDRSRYDRRIGRSVSEAIAFRRKNFLLCTSYARLSRVCSFVRSYVGSLDRLVSVQAQRQTQT